MENVAKYPIIRTIASIAFPRSGQDTLWTVFTILVRAKDSNSNAEPIAMRLMERAIDSRTPTICLGTLTSELPTPIIWSLVLFRPSTDLLSADILFAVAIFPSANFWATDRPPKTPPRNVIAPTVLHREPGGISASSFTEAASNAMAVAYALTLLAVELVRAFLRSVRNPLPAVPREAIARAALSRPFIRPIICATTAIPAKPKPAFITSPIERLSRRCFISALNFLISFQTSVTRVFTAPAQAEIPLLSHSVLALAASFETCLEMYVIGSSALYKALSQSFTAGRILVFMAEYPTET